MPAPNPSGFYAPGRRPRRIAIQSALVVLAAVFLARPSAAQATGDVTTVDIDLHAGKNLVSLPVLPGSSEINEVLASVFDQVEWVTDSRDYFIPRGVSPDNSLSTWQWNTAYEVKMTEAATLSVEGPRLLPNASAISLDADKQNWIPYWGAEALSVSEAFAPIADRLVEVEDDEGRWYRPGDGASTLESLHVGEAYLVRVSDAAVLVYPALPGTEGGILQTSTLAEALAIPNLQVGQEINVLGYYAPGDGGGGLFSVIEAPSTTDLPGDGGTIFIPEVALGDEVEETDYNDGSPGWISYQAWGPVGFGTFSYTIESTDAGGNSWTLEVSDLDLHGANYTAHQPGSAPFFNHATGLMSVRSHDARGVLQSHTGQVAHDIAVRYRPISGTLRLVRSEATAGDVWEARWFGCRADDEAAYFNNAPCINWAFNAMRTQNADAPGTVTALRLSDNDDDGSPETFYYTGPITLAENTELWGERGAEVVDSTDAYGNDFSFVRAHPDATTLKLLPETAPGCNDCRPALGVHQMKIKAYGEAGHLAPTADVFTGGGTTAVTFWEGSQANALRRIVLDGSDTDHLSIHTSDVYSYQDKETLLRNTPSYTGFNAGNHNGKDVSGHKSILEDAVIFGYPATGLITNDASTPTRVDRVAIGNANYNHAIYSYSLIEGEDMTLFGYSWGNPMRAANLSRLSIIDGHASPYRGGAANIGWRGYDEPTCDAAAAAGHPATSCGVLVDDYYFQHRTGGGTWVGAGPEWLARNGTVVWTDGGSDAFGESHNGYFTARYEGIKVENLRLHWGADDGATRALFKTGALDKSYFKNVEMGFDGNGDDRNYDGLFMLLDGDDPGAGEAGEIVEFVFDSIGTEDPIDVRWAYTNTNVSVPPADFHVRYFLRDVHVDQKGNATYQMVRNDYAMTSPDGEAVGGYEFYWEDGTFEMGPGYGTYERKYYTQLINTHRFQGVTDSITGNTSEATGTYACQAGDGTTPRFQLTGLMHIPHPTRGEVSITGGDFSGSVVSWVDDEGDGTTYDDKDDPREPFVRVTLSSPCAPGQTIEWNAAVARWLDANGDPVLFPSEANGGWYPYE